MAARPSRPAFARATTSWGGDEDVTDLASLWRRVWAAGSAGADVRLVLGRDDQKLGLTVRSADRASFLKSPKLH